MSEQTTIWNDGSLDEQENEFIKFTPENNQTVNYKMLVNDPDVKPNKFGTQQYTFEVMNMDTKTVCQHSITSKRYMRALKDYTPLEGKTFCVHKKGEGMETDYQVVLIA